ncbi:MAG: AAA family ATPase [Thermomicrobiales bacterium]
MLIEFRFRNFKSFRDEQVFTMVANNRDHTGLDHTTESSAFKGPLLRTAVLYGANASGKSNLFKALMTLQRFLTEPLDPTNPRIAPEPFRLNDQTLQMPTKFEIIFIHKGVRYEYQLALDSVGVSHEELHAYPKGKPQRWYSRQRLGVPGDFRFDFGSS